MTPIKLLEKELHSMERSIEKSKESFTDGKIGKRLHEQHVANLSPQIEEFRNAIMILKVAQ